MTITPQPPRRNRQCRDSYSLGTECWETATVPLWFIDHPLGTHGPVYYCAEHAASTLRRLPSAFTDRDPNEESHHEEPS